MNEIRDVMRQYVIYKNPTDVCAWPRGGEIYVAREWFVTPQGVLRGWIIAVAPKLEEIRKDIPAAANVRLDRADEDDPAIVEVWV